MCHMSKFPQIWHSTPFGHQQETGMKYKVDWMNSSKDIQRKD